MDLIKEEKLEQLEKVLQSRTLQGSESLRAFLRFVGHKAIENKDVQIKEYTIATEVFGRNSDYDPRIDSVVRVQAGRLRGKLQDYYTTEGKNDSIIIDLPKGQYTPVFFHAQDEHRPSEPPSSTENGHLPAAPLSAAPHTDTEAPVVRPERSTGWSRWPAFVAAGCLIAALAASAMAIYYRSEAGRLRETLTRRDAAQHDALVLQPIWHDFFNDPDPILVAFSNTIFEGRAETGMKLLKPLFSSTNAPPHALSAVAQASKLKTYNGPAITDHYTGVGEVMGVYSLGGVFWKINHPFRVKRSLMLNWDDLKTQNIVVLGSPAENFLLRQLPQDQDFIFRAVKDEKNEPRWGIVNLKPQPGEQEVYLAKEGGASSSQLLEDYALVSVLKGLDEKHKLMTLAGITTFGTQAAVEYVTVPEYAKEMISRLNTSADASRPVLPDYYQVLIQVKVNDGVPVQVFYVTHHVLK